MAKLTDLGKQPQGRPRSERARRAILEATIELVERDGFAAVTVEAIAARAGVSKATIYRWWSNKAAVVMDSFLELAAPKAIFSVDTGSVREDLRQTMRELAQFLSGKGGDIIVALVAESRGDPDVAEALRSRWISVRREAVKKIMRRGIERGELPADLDLEVAIDALYGPIYYRLLAGHAPLDERFVEALADYVMRGLDSSDNPKPFDPVAAIGKDR